MIGQPGQPYVTGTGESPEQPLIRGTVRCPKPLVGDLAKMKVTVGILDQAKTREDGEATYHDVTVRLTCLNYQDSKTEVASPPLILLSEPSPLLAVLVIAPLLLVMGALRRRKR